MRYQQTLEIHQRLEAVPQLIGGIASDLAKNVGAAIPTISCVVARLSARRHMRAARHDGGWHCLIHIENRPRMRRDSRPNLPTFGLRRLFESRLANQDKSEKNPDTSVILRTRTAEMGLSGESINVH